MEGDRVSDQPKTNWGIISSAAIGRRALAPAIHEAKNARLACFGTPNATKVAEEAKRFGSRILPSYNDVLEDPDVEVVYNPLPNGMHAEWTIRALRAGKHVLCEKPFSVTPEETVEMIAAARESGRWLMEAFMYRFHPQIALARALVHQPALVLADEPTGNLDSRAAEQVMEILLRLAAAHEATVVLVTHNAEMAASADRIIELRDGRVLRDEVRTSKTQDGDVGIESPPLQDGEGAGG